MKSLALYDATSLKSTLAAALFKSVYNDYEFVGVERNCQLPDFIDRNTWLIGLIYPEMTIDLMMRYAYRLNIITADPAVVEAYWHKMTESEVLCLYHHDCGNLLAYTVRFLQGRTNSRKQPSAVLKAVLQGDKEIIAALESYDLRELEQIQHLLQLTPAKMKILRTEGIAILRKERLDAIRNS